MALHRTPVKVDYQIDFADPASCRKNNAKYEEYDSLAVKFIDGQISAVIPSNLESDQYIGVRSYMFDRPVDRFSIYVTFYGPKAMPGNVFPTLKWRIQVGIGPENERAVEGSYTPSEMNETGLLLSFCAGRIFRTVDFCMNIVDAQGATISNIPMQLSLGGYAHLSNSCFPTATTGEDGTITWIAKDYRPTVVILP
jgi:hypothetical protein